MLMCGTSMLRAKAAALGRRVCAQSTCCWTSLMISTQYHSRSLPPHQVFVASSLSTKLSTSDASSPGRRMVTTPFLLS